MRLEVPAGIASLALALAAAAPTQKQAPNDAEAIAFAIAVDSGEIMQADLALSKKPSEAVTAYAKMLKDDHEDHLRDVIGVANKLNLTDVPKIAWVDSMKTKGMEAHTQLTGKDGKDFEMMFLDAMIKGHTEALETIDKKLLPSGLGDDVKNEIEDLRKGVEAHLARAKALRNG